jgi:hypothetical protein
METLQITHPVPVEDTAIGPFPGIGAADALAECRRMADAADAAIDQAYSGDAEKFLAANQQDGGQ